MVTPTTAAGIAADALDEISLGTDSPRQSAVSAAVNTRTCRSNSNCWTVLPEQTGTTARDFQSAISVPLQYNDINYGVVTVYATQPDAFDDLSQGVFQELGETVANAMNFIDTRQALFTDRVVELELAIHNADDPPVRLEEWYPETELVARRDKERADQSLQAFETALTGELTDRQLQILQTAYHSGYFEWPRDRTGEEVAEALDITQPTFNGHLRAAERKLCAMFFE